MARKLNNNECVGPIRKREEFSNRGGSLTGTQRRLGHLGYLPARYYPSMRTALFIVWSYNTPIAWYGPDFTVDLTNPAAVETFLREPVPDGWHMPAVWYSRDTSNHQGLVEAALGWSHVWYELDEHGNRFGTFGDPLPHYARTEHASASHRPGAGRKFERVPAGTGRQGTWG